MAAVVLSFLYFALDIIALSFPVIIVSNSTYVAPAGRESEFPRTRVATWRSRDLYRTGSTIAGISIARAIRVLDPIQSLDRYPLV